MENEELNPEVPQEQQTEQTPEGTEETTEPTEEKDWQSEAAKWRRIAERNKKKSQTLTKEEVDPELKKDVELLKSERTKRDFGYKHNLSPEEVDAVFKVNPNPTEETLKDPFIQGGLEKVRTSKRVESNTPSPSGRQFSVGGKSWDEMDRTEKNKHYPEYMEALKKTRRG